MEKYKLTQEKLEKNLPYAKGIEKELLEADTLLMSNKLVRQTLKKLKWNNIVNLIYLIIGGFITYFFTSILGSDIQKETIKELHNLKTEKNALKIDFQNNLNEQNTLILEIKREIDSLK